MLTVNDYFRLESDMSKTAAREALSQFQQGPWVLTSYHSHKVPKAVTNYRSRKIELTCSVCNLLFSVKY